MKYTALLKMHVAKNCNADPSVLVHFHLNHFLAP